MRAEPHLIGDGPARQHGPGTPVYAALDIGTNNCRLLIARPSRHGFRVIDAFSRIVRLGEGVAKTGRLNPAAMERTIDALRICADKMARRRVTSARAVATEACRKALNGRDFLRKAEAETGVRIDLITGQEEARLAFAGCAPLLDPRIPRAVIFDIGGGSSELLWVAVQPDETPVVIDQLSVPIGVVALSERYGGDLVSAAAYDQMITEIAAEMRGFAARNRIAESIARHEVQMVGASGTVTTLSAIQQNLPRYERSMVDGSFLDTAVAKSISRRLLKLDFLGRAAHPCIGQDRADMVVAGCAVLEAILTIVPVGRLRIADRGVREGILCDLMADPSP